ncbi:MAG: SDH family Clp fold serine proteinase, partial [Bacteroidia bacterium]
GSPVSKKEKTERAIEIAQKLGNNKLWHSHGRSIGIKDLTTTLKLKIEDYSKDAVLQPLIREYNDIICHYISKMDYKFFLHSRKSD